MSGDADGWKRGAGPYSRSYPKLDRPETYEKKPLKSAKSPSGGYDDNSWPSGFSGALPKGGAPRIAPKSPSSMKPVRAASPSGKFRRV